MVSDDRSVGALPGVAETRPEARGATPGVGRRRWQRRLVYALLIGYAVLMVRNRLSRPMRTKRLVKALSPYLVAQLAVLIAVLAYPALVWRGPADETAPGQVIQPTTNDDTGVLFERDPEQGDAETPADGKSK